MSGDWAWQQAVGFGHTYSVHIIPWLVNTGW
jgi:hypothetical protein